MSRKDKIAPAEKQRIIERYLYGEVGHNEASREIGVDGATISVWASRYKAEGAAAFLPDKRNRKYTKETKLTAVLDYLAGKGSIL